MLSEQAAIPPPLQIIQMAFGRHVSQAIGAAAKFDFATHLATGPKTADQLAELTGAHAQSIYRLLRALASVGVFTELDSGAFANTPTSETLRSDIPGSTRAMVLYFNHPFHLAAWNGLPYSVETGKCGFQHVHGQAPWDYLATHPDVAAVFNDAMTSVSAQIAFGVLSAYDFSGIERLVDVGGGQGLLLGAILSRYPSMRGVLFDQPPVVAGARGVLESTGVAQRVEVVGGNFFESAPPGDAYVMKHVIHDWDDADAGRILANVHRASAPGGKLLIVESVIRPGNEPDLGKILDLEILIVTQSGRERTAEEFGRLLAASGFELTRVIPTPAPAVIVEAIRR